MREGGSAVPSREVAGMIRRMIHPKHVHEHIPRHQMPVQEEVRQQGLRAARQSQLPVGAGVNDADMSEQCDLQRFHVNSWHQ